MSITPENIKLVIDIIGGVDVTVRGLKWLFEIVLRKFEPIYKLQSRIKRGKAIDFVGGQSLEPFISFWKEIQNNTIRSDAWIEIDGFLSRYVPLVPGLAPVRLGTIEDYLFLFNKDLRRLREEATPENYIEKRLQLKQVNMFEFGLGMLRPPDFDTYVLLGLTRNVVEFGIPIFMTREVFDKRVRRPLVESQFECVYSTITGRVKALSTKQMLDTALDSGLQEWYAEIIQDRLGILPSVMLAIDEVEDINIEQRKEGTPLLGRAWAQYLIKGIKGEKELSFSSLWIVKNIFDEDQHSSAIRNMNVLVNTYAKEKLASGYEIIGQYDYYRNRFPQENLLQVNRDGTISDLRSY
jgi:hypothetical protein